MPERESLQQEITALTQNPEAILSDAAFNALALRVFQFQFEHNAPYRGYCERRDRRPDAVQRWLDVPAVPTAAFKEAKLISGDAADTEAVFLTSGTTQGTEKRGAHYVLDLSIYRASLLPAFQAFVLPDLDRMRMISLIPEWRAGGNSSLSYMASVVMQKLAASGSWYAVDNDGMDVHRLTAHTRDLNEPVCFLGTSLAFVHWLDHLQTTRETLQLPDGSRIMDTGGFKGSRRSITNTELRTQYTRLLGIPARYAVNEYGMTEMLSQFYDQHLRSPERVSLKAGPSWVHSAVVHPDTLEPLHAGQTGLLRHFDLANVYSVSAIQTEDLGRYRADGFELLGRAAGATPRGCSIAMDIFLSAARR